jgi:L-fuconolactonase
VTPTADAHIHLFANGFAGVGGSSPAGGDELAAYERLRGRHGIVRALVVGYEGDPRYAGNNRDILDYAAEREWIVPLPYVPVAPAPTAGELRGLKRSGGQGVALYLRTAGEGKSLGSWTPAQLAELCAQRAVISLNAVPAATAEVADVLEHLGGCCVLFSHLGLPGRFDRPPKTTDARNALAPLLALARHPHVAVKLSGLYGISAHPHRSAQPFVDLVLEAFGPSRLLWASDFPAALDHITFEQAADSGCLSMCSQEDIADVMGGNLLRLIGSRSKFGDNRL